jgi:hypothetical protein
MGQDYKKLEEIMISQAVTGENRHLRRKAVFELGYNADFPQGVPIGSLPEDEPALRSPDGGMKRIKKVIEGY